MLRKCSRPHAWLTIILLGLCLSSPARPAVIEILTNGGFESGTLVGWTVQTRPGSLGSFYIDDADGFTPVGGLETVGPANGDFYAVSDSAGPGTQALLQAFTVPAGAVSATLAFDMFVNDWSGIGPIVDPGGLDHTGGPNQHARVDIMSAGADPFDAEMGVLSNLYLAAGAGILPDDYTSYLFDITSLVGNGGTFQLRFAEVDTEFFLNVGIDNASIAVVMGPSKLSEPSTYALLLLGFLPLAGRRRSRKATS